MKKTRKISTNPLTLLLILTSFLFMSCGGDDYVNSANPSARSNIQKSLSSSYTGIELFESVIFADGPLTSEIDEIADLTPEKLGMDSIKVRDFRILKADIINLIDIQNPNFFDDFKGAITSGDPVVIEQVLDNAQSKVYTALESHLASQNIALEDVVKEYNDGNNHYPSLPDIPVTTQGLAIAILVTIVLVFGIAIAAIYTKYKVEDIFEQNDYSHGYAANIKKGRVVARIATKLKA